VRERLASTTLAAPVRAVRLEAHHFTAPAVLQSDCFSRDQETGAAIWRPDRLSARLGPAGI
jgi:hypothetical protein